MPLLRQNFFARDSERLDAGREGLQPAAQHREEKVP
jgi:hypothetical protein